VAFLFFKGFLIYSMSW